MLSHHKHFIFLISPTTGPTPHRPGAFSCPHSPGPNSDYLLCFCGLSTPAVRCYRRNEHPPGCWREQICSWAILRGVGDSGAMAFGADCVTGGAVGSSEKEGALPMRFAGWLGGQKGPLWHRILMGEYWDISSIFSHIDLTNHDSLCYDVICNL